SRERTGKGMAVEAPMFESLVSFMFTEHLNGYVFDPPIGTLRYDRVTSPHRRPYRTADGYVATLPYSTKHWDKILRFIGRDDLAEAAWVRDAATRSQRIGELYAVLAEAMTERTTSEWLSELKRMDIPCGPVNTLEDLLDDEHLKAVGFFQSQAHPSEGAVRATRQPLRFISAPEQPDQPAPRLGENARVILHEYGMDNDTIDELIAAGTLVIPGDDVVD